MDMLRTDKQSLNIANKLRWKKTNIKTFVYFQTLDDCMIFQEFAVKGTLTVSSFKLYFKH